MSLAWRPYHIAVSPGFASDAPHHAVALPLWLVALPAVIAGAYTYGLVVGARRGDKSLCTCGYSRAGLAVSTACPECGKK